MSGCSSSDKPQEQHLSAPVSHREIRGEGLGWAAGSEHLFSARFTLSRYDKTIIREALQFVRCLVRTTFLTSFVVVRVDWLVRFGMRELNYFLLRLRLGEDRINMLLYL